MRYFLCILSFTLLSSLALPAGEKREPAKNDLPGSWTVVWPNDTANQMKLMVPAEKGEESFEGTYINDDKDMCKVTGRFDREKGTVTFSITAPRWNAKCEGRFVNANLIEGTYLAFGDSAGSFRMVRNPTLGKQ